MQSTVTAVSAHMAFYYTGLPAVMALLPGLEPDFFSQLLLHKEGF